MKFVVTRGGDREMKLDADSQRYKPPLISTRDVMDDMINIINTDVCYMWKLLESKSQEFQSWEEMFSFSFTLNLCKIDVH